MITSEDTVAIMFNTGYADLVQLRAREGGTFEVWADGLRVGAIGPTNYYAPIRGESKLVGQGWRGDLVTPVPCELLRAGTREQLVGLMLRTANQLCAKACFQGSLL